MIYSFPACCGLNDIISGNNSRYGGHKPYLSWPKTPNRGDNMNLMTHLSILHSGTATMVNSAPDKYTLGQPIVLANLLMVLSAQE